MHVIPTVYTQFTCVHVIPTVYTQFTCVHVIPTVYTQFTCVHVIPTVNTQFTCVHVIPTVYMYTQFTCVHVIPTVYTQFTCVHVIPTVSGAENMASLDLVFSPTTGVNVLLVALTFGVTLLLALTSDLSSSDSPSDPFFFGFHGFELS